MNQQAMWNLLKGDRELYTQTAEMMKLFKKRLGTETLCSLFNSVVKDDRDALYRAEKVCTFKGQYAE